MKPSPRRVSVLAAAALPLSLLVFACGGESAEAPPAEAIPNEDPELGADLDNGPAALPVTLEPVNDSGVEGRATAIQSDDSVQLNLMVQGLPREGEYQAHIHRGTCDTGGAVVVPLNPVLVESDGMGRSMTTLPTDRLSPGVSHFVQVHGASGVLACGDMHGS